LSHALLEEFARLLTLDTHACVQLFAHDGECRARLGREELHFRGRAAIQAFLCHVPRQIRFQAGEVVAEGDGFRGELELTAADLLPASRGVRFRVQDGHIARFELLS
jgi:hypothetical protein